MTRVEQIVQTITARIRSEASKSGERLPSIRQAARDHGVSKNTMAEAYDRLVAEGLLEGRVGSGYLVVHRHLASSNVPQPHVVEATDALSLLREQLDQHYDVRPGDGRPPPSWMEASELRRYFEGFRVSGGSNVDFGYGSTRGHGPLRELLRTLLLDRSIAAKPDGLLLTHGANHALDLIIRHLVEPGDTVFVDDPGYYPLFGKLALANANIVGVRRGADGPDLEDLNTKLATRHPKVFFTQSQAHNPTGSSLSPAVAFGLLQAAERWNFHLVEDDAFADIVSPTLPRLAALDQLERVLYVGTFSKTLSASLRSGFVAGHPAMIGALRDIKMITTIATSDFVERFIFNLIRSGQYLRHLRRLRARLEEANRRSIAALEAIGFSVQSNKVPGFYLWIQLPAYFNEQELCRAAAAEGIFTAPAQAFRPYRIDGDQAAMRVNVAYGADPRFLAFLQRSGSSSHNSQPRNRKQG